MTYIDVYCSIIAFLSEEEAESCIISIIDEWWDEGYYTARHPKPNRFDEKLAFFNEYSNESLTIIKTYLGVGSS